MRMIASIILLALVTSCTHKPIAIDAATPVVYSCLVRPYQLSIKILATNPGSALDEAMFIANKLGLNNYSVYCAPEANNVREQR
jgi:hypothetical protein